MNIPLKEKNRGGLVHKTAFLLTAFAATPVNHVS